MTGVATYKRYGRTVYPAKVDPVEFIKMMIRDLKGNGDLDPKSAGSWMDGVQVLVNNSTGAKKELAKAYAEASQGWNDSQRPGGIGTLRDLLKKAQKKIKRVEESSTGGGMRFLIERLELLEAIPQEKLKRANVRPSGEVGLFDSGASKYGMTQRDMIGWFSSKSNEAVGWHIFDPSNEDKREFGANVKRVFSGRTNTTTIAKFDLVKGTYAFLDNGAYESGKIIFQKMSPYRKLVIENTPKAFKSFGIV